MAAMLSYPTAAAAPAAGHAGPSLLCADDATRRRMLDMEHRVHPARLALFAILLLTLVGLAPWVGWWPIIPLIAVAAAFQAADRRMPCSARPEYWIMGAWAFSQAMIALSIVFTGGPRSAFAPWLALPAATLATRFNVRGIAAGVALTIALLVAATVGVAPGVVARSPQLLFVPLTLLAGVVVLSTALMSSDIEHRTAAAIDALTGLYNRQALMARGAELTEQARVARTPLGAVIGDLDHFKEVNDQRGHLVGDRVLRDVAATLRTTLRTFDYVFRYGGEEFVILLPGNDIDEAVRTAERLRVAVAASMPAAIDMRMSFGVGLSVAGQAGLDELLAAADGALYRAKRDGRDRVRAAIAAPAASREPGASRESRA